MNKTLAMIDREYLSWGDGGHCSGCGRKATVYHHRSHKLFCLPCIRQRFMDLPPRGNGWPVYQTIAGDWR